MKHIPGVFASEVPKETIPSVESIQFVDTIVVESDICTKQYKSSEHFHLLQKNSHFKLIVSIYTVAGHGSGDVHHAGGLLKVAILERVDV